MRPNERLSLHFAAGYMFVLSSSAHGRARLIGSCLGPMAERQTDRTDTFLREVDEELRREQLQKLWDAYGIYAVAAAALVVLGVGGYQWSMSRAQSQREAAGARFEVAQSLASQGKPEEAAQAFAAIVKDAPAGYRTLARFQVAAANARAGKADAAVADYEAIAKDGSADPILRDFATLQAAMLRLDAADWTEMENRLTPLLGEKSAWRGMARETLGLAAHKAGKTAEARKLFEELLGDRSAPGSASERAMLMLSLLTDAEASKGAETPAAQPAPATPIAPAKSETEAAKKPPAEKKK